MILFLLALMKDLEMEKMKSQQAFQKLDEKSKQFQKLQVLYITFNTT